MNGEADGEGHGEGGEDQDERVDAGEEFVEGLGVGAEEVRCRATM